MIGLTKTRWPLKYVNIGANGGCSGHEATLALAEPSVLIAYWMICSVKQDSNNSPNFFFSFVGWVWIWLDSPSIYLSVYTFTAQFQLSVGWHCKLPLNTVLLEGWHSCQKLVPFVFFVPRLFLLTVKLWVSATLKTRTNPPSTCPNSWALVT